MGQSENCRQAGMTRPRLVRWGDTTRYLTCRAAGCIQGVIPSVCVLCFSVARFLVYFSLCEETSKNTVCWIITEYRLTDYSNKGVTFYLLFSVAGLIFCVVNSLINLLLFCNQSKGILGSWFTWVFLCSVGHIVWSFQQSLSGPVSWLSGGYPGVLSLLYQVSLICCSASVAFVFCCHRYDRGQHAVHLALIATRVSHNSQWSPIVSYS